MVGAAVVVFVIVQAIAVRVVVAAPSDGVGTPRSFVAIAFAVGSGWSPTPGYPVDRRGITLLVRG